jgi:hypothetical protein
MTVCAPATPPTPAISVDQFRLDFPQFASEATYPTTMVQLWLNFATTMLNVNRWGSAYPMGIELFAAHNLVLDGLALQEANNGAVPGTTVGPVSSKSVGGVSVNYDTGSGVNAEDTHWNLTSFGTRFARLFRMFGQGPLQVGIGRYPINSGPAWPGVIYPYW